MAFSPDTHGTYLTNHLKLLHLALSDNKPRTVNRIQSTDELLPSINRLLQTMLKTHVRLYCEAIMTDVTIEHSVSLCKRRGFIYQGSEIYGGLAGTWDYGPLGVVLKRNIVNLWWQFFVDSRDDMFGIESAILMNPKVWQASGHIDTFHDPLIEDTVTTKR